MAVEELLAHLLGLAEPETQRQFLSERISALNPRHVDALVEALRQRVIALLLNDCAQAWQTADLAHHLAQITGQPFHRALALRLLAQVLSLCQGNHQEALTRYDESLAIYDGQNNPLGRAHVEVTRIWALDQVDRHEEALQAGAWADPILVQHDEWRSWATLQNNLAAIHNRARENQDALRRLDLARAGYGRLGAAGERALPNLELNRGLALLNLGRFEEAIEANERAIARAHQLDQAHVAALALSNQALVYFMLGEYNRALTFFDQAQARLWQAGRPANAAMAELGLTECLLQLRRFAAVVEKCQRLRQHFMQSQLVLEAAQAIRHEALAYAGLRRYDQAITVLAEARRLLAAEKKPFWEAMIDLDTAAFQLAQRQFEAALTTADACAAVFRQESCLPEAAQADLVAARAALALQRHALARQRVDSALAVAQAEDVPPLAHQGYQLLGQMAQAQGDPPAALAYYDRAINELERLQGRLMVEFRAGFLEDKATAYEQMVGLCLDAGQAAEGLRTAERAKSRALLELLASRLNLSLHAASKADRPLVEHINRLQARRDELYRQWQGLALTPPGETEDSEPALAELQREIQSLEKEAADQWHELWIHNADHYGRQASLWQVRVEPAQPYLEPDTLLIEYFEAGGQLVVFLVTADDTRAHRLPASTRQVQQLLQKLRLNLGVAAETPPAYRAELTVKAQAILQQLYNLLLLPLQESLAAYPRLIIVPHGPLHYLPFQALYDGRAYLLENHEITYLPASSFLRYCQRPAEARGAALVAGYSYEGRLPHAAEEARAVAAIWGSPPLLDDAVTRAQVTSAAPDSRLIHLATHGDFRPDAPLFSGLALADGWLATLDIFNLRLRASLVTLSACQTGQSVVGGGDELIGLMRAFLAAGAASLALTLWAVEDRSTARLMAGFYRSLAAGETKAAALRAAQLALLRGEGEWGAAEHNTSHPYFWAPFFLVGHAGPL